ncbi:MAG: hypothetical protein HOE53_01565 [Candidatus Magasanikbacteria bacterium]|jgi:hypothetical protein|nr:hypothetical protein [Candidatus Magasanikbacteria bacterium]
MHAFIIAFLTAGAYATFLSWQTPADLSQYQIELLVLLGASLTLFMFCFGLYYSRQSARFHNLRTLLSEEHAYWMALYDTAALYSPKVERRIARIIDEFCIRTHDARVVDYYKANRPHIHDVFLALKQECGSTSPHADMLYSDMIGFLAKIEALQLDIATLSREQLRSHNWIIMMLLGSSAMSLLVAGFTQTLLLQITTGSIIVTVVLMLWGLLRIDHLMGKWPILAQFSHSLIDEISYPQYIHHAHKGHRKLRKHVANRNTHRVGKHQVGKNIRITVI